MIRRQPLAMRVNQIIDEVPDLVEAEFGGGVGVEHGGVVDVLSFLGEGGFDG